MEKKKKVHVFSTYAPIRGQEFPGCPQMESIREGSGVTGPSSIPMNGKHP